MKKKYWIGIMFIVGLVSMTNCTNPKFDILTKQPLCTLSQTADDTTFLVDIAKDERLEWWMTQYHNGDFFLQYTIKHVWAEDRYPMHKGEASFQTYLIHFIPDCDNRIRIETRLESSVLFYDNLRKIDESVPSGRWKPDHFLDEWGEQSVYAIIYDYYMQHKSEIRIIKDEYTDN